METHRFDGRVAVVTGAGRGLGRAYATLLARRGAKVVVNDLRVTTDGGFEASASPADECVSHIRREGGAAVADYSDISTPVGASDLIGRALSEFGSLDILVNNAGIVEYHPFEAVSSDQFYRTLAVNAGGHFFTTQAAWLYLKAQGYGRIVMTTSGVALYGMMDPFDYACSKCAIVGLSKCLALEAAGSGVIVNAVSPYAFTRMGDHITDTEIRRRSLIALQPDFVAPLVGWLCHESCTVNGEIFDVGGGRAARVFIGETAGIQNRAMTIETVAASLGKILDETNYKVPAETYEVTATMMAQNEE